jgi:hypothetical protein
MLKKKYSNLKISVELFGADLEKLDTKLDSLITNAEIFKEKVIRESTREVRRLEREIELMKAALPAETANSLQTSTEELQIAKTIGIFECLLRHLCENADDFRLVSESFLFPAVYERVVDGKEEAYFLEEIPTSIHALIKQGKEYLTWIRSECQTHLTDPEAWEQYSQPVVDWWRNTALPLIYNARDDQWDIDEAYSLREMLAWENAPGDRPLNFPKIFDGYEIYRKNKDAIYGETGIRTFDLKMFNYGTPEQED